MADNTVCPCQSPFTAKVKKAHMSLRPAFRCIVIGDGSLPLHCGDILLARGHTIVAFVATTADAYAWSTQHAVRRFDDDTDLTQALAHESVDFLFSIVNSRILSVDTCTIARRGAINYHDALLPRYAGMHATTWAIMAGEQEHGVTWHDVVERVDAGRIYVQRVVPIASDDTAMTLNVKCYEAATTSFMELLEGLEQNTITPRLQVLANRSYFGKHHRPPAAATINWDQNAAAVSAFVRALDFGTRTNPLAVPKVWIRAVPYACRSVQLLDGISTSVPGTVVAVDEAGLVVAARDRLVRIPTLTTLHGDAVTLASLGVQPGERLTGPSSTDADSIDACTARAARSEQQWIQCLAESRAPVLPAAQVSSTAQASANQSARRDCVTIQLPNARIEDAHANDDATLVAALAVYLSRIGGDAPVDITLRVTPAASGETTPVCSDHVFIASRPLRCVVDPAVSLRDIVPTIRSQLRQLRAHGPIARDVFARYPSLHISSVESTLLFTVMPDDQSATLDFDLTFAPHDVMRRVAEHLEALLADAVLHPSRSVGTLEIMSTAERTLVLHTWNDTRVPYPRDVTIAELFGRVAMATPDAVAITEDHAQLTYRALDERANQLAHRLQRLGVTADTIVGHCMDRSADAIVGMLGILKAGGAYLPLDAENPPARLAYMLADSNVRIVVTSLRLRTVIPTEMQRDILCVDDSTMREERTDTPVSDAGAESLAYVMYTSGSTGRPKGVAITHRGVVRLVSNTNYVHFGADDVRLGFAPLAFDASTFEIWGALLHGGRLALFPNQLPTPFDLGRFVERHGVTTVWLTSALFGEMVDSALSAFRNVRQLLTGGEVLSRRHVRRMLQALPNCRVINCYGPTENTTFSTCYTVPRAWLDEPATAAVPIGHPIANSTAYVLDARKQPLPIGVVGELFAGGDGVARGYVNNASTTAAHFVANPFDGAIGARLYATGDLARWRRDGALDFVGRRDTQVKIRGFRIELGEIEVALATHPDVRAVAVVAVVAVVAPHDRSGDSRLVAFYTPTADRLPSVHVLRDHLLAQLPVYMVPTQYVALTEWPLTATDKIDRAALTVAALSHLSAVNLMRNGPAPTSPIEIALTAIWCDVLGVQHVDLHDDFFALGGHSLTAMRVLSLVSDRFSVRLPLRTMFDSPTIGGLASHVARMLAEQRTTDHTNAGHDALDATPAPLSLGQEVLWLLQRSMPTLDAYNVVEQWRIDGFVDVSALERALNALVDRHAALRTTFRDENNGPVQIVCPASPVRLDLVDVNGQSAAAQDSLVQRLVRQPFNLSQDLLFRATLLRESDVSYRLVIETHHIIDDGWSRTILRRELAALYDAFAAGRNPSLLPPTQPFATFAAQQRALLENGDRRIHESYWRMRLSDWQPTSYVRPDRSRPTVIRFEGAAVSLAISADTMASVSAVARAQGATPFMVLFAAFQLLLHRYSGERDVVVGTVSASRAQRDWEEVIGYFATPMAIRTSFDGDPTFIELIARVRDEQLRAMEHAAVPIELVMMEPIPGGIAHPLPLFRVMCVLQSADRAALRLGAAVVRVLPVEMSNTKFDLSLVLTECDDTLDATIEYRTSMFDEPTIVKLLEHFSVLLQAAVSAPNTRVARIPLVSALERQRMLVDWNMASASMDERRLHDLVDEQVQRSPHAIALVGTDLTLTYAELSQRVQVLARDLVARGVGPNVLVGVCVERSVHLVVALLAVLTAGGAYVPLDPDYPRDRIRYMLADSGATIVITAGATRDVLLSHNATTLHVDDEYWTNAPNDMAKHVASSQTTADDLAYVSYTSGSTGRPKGAMNTHRAVCNFVQRSVALHGFTNCDTVLQKTPVSFDPSVWEMFGALTTGARLVFARPRGHADPTYLAAIIAQHNVTAMNVVPAMLQALLDVPTLTSQARSLRIIVCGGEVMPPALQNAVFALLPTVRLHNAYGPTETAVNACDWECERDTMRATVPIGRPLPNVHVYCLDESREPVPPGVVGELYIGGAAVGVGYFGQPELSAERFISWPDPSRPTHAERLYRTGDLACTSREGIIEYLGRRDQQIKLRGVRIELGEIEAALAAHNSVRAAVVVLRDDARNGDRRLVAYVVPRTGTTVSERALREYLREMLLDAMIPSAFVVLAALPISPTGKIDRNSLPIPTYDRKNEEEFVAPHTETERTLENLMVEVLGVIRVGIHDNFFEIGGHSLAAMSVVSRALTVGMTLSVSDVFDHPTLAALASIADAQRHAVGVGNPASMSIPRVARGTYRREVAGPDNK